MSQTQKTVRIQVVVDAIDRAMAEDLTKHWYGLSLNLFLRLVIKQIAQEKLDISFIAGEGKHNPSSPKNQLSYWQN